MRGIHQHRPTSIFEPLEDRRLFSVYLGSSPSISSYVNVGFRLNPVAQVMGTVDGKVDSNINDFVAKVNFGDSGTWYSAQIAPPMNDTDEMLVKASHVYTQVANKPITVWVENLRDGSTLKEVTCEDFAGLLPSIYSRPGTKPDQYDASRLPSYVSLQTSSVPSISAYTGVGFESNVVGTFTGQLNGQVDDNPSHYHAQVDWGDGGGWLLAQVVPSKQFPARMEVQDSHTYHAPGNYPVVIYLNGPDGQSLSGESTEVFVSNMPNPIFAHGTTPLKIINSEKSPVADVRLQFGSAPSISSFAGVGFRLNPLAVISGSVAGKSDFNNGDYTAYVNWGDSTGWSTTKITDSYDGSYPMQVKGSHTYAHSGNYPVVVYLEGPGGQTIDACTTECFVNLMPGNVPHVGIEPAQQTAKHAPGVVSMWMGSAASIQVHVGQAVSSAVLAKVEGTYDNTFETRAGEFHAQVNWDDSLNWSSASVVPNGSLLGTPFVVKGSHTYNQTGNYAVVVYITGPDGQTISACTTEVFVIK
jgi:hypothetical protein